MKLYNTIKTIVFKIYTNALYNMINALHATVKQKQWSLRPKESAARSDEKCAPGGIQILKFKLLLVTILEIGAETFYFWGEFTTFTLVFYV